MSQFQNDINYTKEERKNVPEFTSKLNLVDANN